MSPYDIGMNHGTLELWFAYPGDVLTDEAARKCAALSSKDELSRMERLRSKENRQEYLVAHALLRTALSHVRPVPPEAWRFCANSYGKPQIEPDCGVRFNLSHSRALVVCLISNQVEVGVDVEHRDRAGEIAEIAEDVFSPLELAQLEELRAEEKPDRALSLWTLQEAYIKARGMGLTLPLRKISFVFGGVEGIRLEIDASGGDDARSWQFCLLDFAGHRIALMKEQAEGANVELWESRPILATPKRLAEVEQTWYPIVRSAR